MSTGEKAEITDTDLIKMYLWAKERNQDGDFDLKTFEGQFLFWWDFDGELIEFNKNIRLISDLFRDRFKRILKMDLLEQLEAKTIIEIMSLAMNKVIEFKTETPTVSSFLFGSKLK